MLYKTDKAVLRAYARATLPVTLREIGYNQATALRKVANATPHDLGAPNEHPWEKTNYTSYQDCNLWKDFTLRLCFASLPGLCFNRRN